jgi:hypothetical protein
MQYVLVRVGKETILLPIGRGGQSTTLAALYMVPLELEKSSSIAGTAINSVHLLQQMHILDLTC